MEISGNILAWGWGWGWWGWGWGWGGLILYEELLHIDNLTSGDTQVCLAFDY
jgi:hypothetical protein